MAPGGSRPTEPPEAIQAEFVLALPPATASALPGFGGVTGKCARSMSAAGNVPVDLWHRAHCESSGSGPAGCARPVPLMFDLSLIHISEPTRLLSISYAVFCLKK